MGEAQQDLTYPISELWHDIDVEWGSDIMSERMIPSFLSRYYSKTEQQDIEPSEILAILAEEDESSPS
jgi:hypothetical protein